MSPARPSATASSTRGPQRSRALRPTKSSSMRCITPLLRGERELAVGDRFGAPRVVQTGEMSGVELVLRAHDDARHGLGEPEEGALALEDLGQHLAPAAVGAAAAGRHPIS